MYEEPGEEAVLHASEDELKPELDLAWEVSLTAIDEAEVEIIRGVIG